ncbi:hypothetical protein BD410DRAFT_785264 [Rickenella mellea]|uniref:Uncharacterized protein n=1 Tax=Rickenella mellea TaxID=50990 RepID=A0A4Y7QEP6_9AGAM|nr:hypothetical protein BD410DRAFT_785264 [Rickenella mellea]
MKRSKSPNVGTLGPRKRAKIHISNSDLKAIQPDLDKNAKRAGKQARDDPEDADEFIALFLIQLVTALSNTSLKNTFLRSLTLPEAREIVKILDTEKAVENLMCGRWQAFLDLPSLHILPPPKQPDIADAWHLQYQGKSHHLWEHISSACSHSPSLYAHFCAIIQSSGTGKSRLIDELAKEQFVIPINLRMDKVGWPPEDEGVRKFLTNPSEGHRRFQSFFIALFVEIAVVMNEKRRGKGRDEGDIMFADHADMCKWFHGYMAPRRNSLTHNERRMALYRRVVGRAEKVFKNLTIVDTDPYFGRKSREADAARVSQMSPNGKDQLDVDNISTGLLAPLGDPVANRHDVATTVNITELSKRFVSFLRGSYPPRSSGPLVEVVCAFDGADTLPFEKEEERPDEFPSFQHAARQLARSIFSVFLSTNPKISRSLHHARVADESYEPETRILTRNFTVPAPFTALPFDILVEEITNQGFSLAKAVTVEYMAQFGRPIWASLLRAAVLESRDLVLFAAQKLLRRPITWPLKLSENESLAVLSTLLALDYCSKTLRDHEEEQRQVAHHMRVCFDVSSDFHTMVTVSPSEPILAEAALLCLRYSEMTPGKMLDDVLGRSLVAAGDRGEHIAAFLCLKASLDARKYQTTAKLSLLNFLKFFLRADVSKFEPSVSSGSQLPLGKAFESAYVYFNHAIKLSTPEVAKASVLWATVARGALIVLANSHKGADLLVLICMGDQVTADSVTFGIIRINRDGSFTFSDASTLISAMDPYAIGLYPSGHQFKHPIIRLVMSFYSEAETTSVPASANVSSEADLNASFTSYDVWCGGISEQVYACILKGEVWDYLGALRTCTPLSKMFSDPNITKEAEVAHRSQLPMFALQKGHWGWTNILEGGG